MLEKILVGLTVGSLLLFDVHYFTRSIPFILKGLYKRKRSLRKGGAAKPVTDWHSSYGICTTNDLDFFLHMNNVRYLREFEFARSSYLFQSGIWQATKDLGGSGLVGAVSVRYRRSVTLFQVFRIRTRLIYWTDRDLYTEQFMETVHDDFVRAVSFSKVTFTGPLTVEKIFEIVTNGNVPGELEPSPDLKCWIEGNKISSEKLRKKD